MNRKHPILDVETIDSQTALSTGTALIDVGAIESIRSLNNDVGGEIGSLVTTYTGNTYPIRLTPPQVRTELINVFRHFRSSDD